MPNPNPSTGPQVTPNSPAQIRSANVPFSQSLARDIEPLAYQLNELSRTLADLQRQLRAQGLIT
jgi:hypothetical protein